MWKWKRLKIPIKRPQTEQSNAKDKAKSKLYSLVALVNHIQRNNIFQQVTTTIDDSNDVRCVNITRDDITTIAIGQDTVTKSKH